MQLGNDGSMMTLRLRTPTAAGRAQRAMTRFLRISIRRLRHCVLAALCFGGLLAGLHGDEQRAEHSLFILRDDTMIIVDEAPTSARTRRRLIAVFGDSLTIASERLCGRAVRLRIAKQGALSDEEIEAIIACARLDGRSLQLQALYIPEPDETPTSESGRTYSVSETPGNALPEARWVPTVGWRWAVGPLRPKVNATCKLLRRNGMRCSAEVLDCVRGDPEAPIVFASPNQVPFDTQIVSIVIDEVVVGRSLDIRSFERDGARQTRISYLSPLWARVVVAIMTKQN